MIHHEIDPKEFLKYVHDIDLSCLNKDDGLRNEFQDVVDRLKLDEIEEKNKELTDKITHIEEVFEKLLNFSYDRINQKQHMQLNQDVF